MGTRHVQHINRGKTWYGPSQTIDTSAYDPESVMMEGAMREFPHTAPTDVELPLSNRMVLMVWMRNTSGITVYPGMAVTHASGYEGRRFDGYSESTAERIAGIVDSHLNTTTGCRNGDCCWVAIRGPEYCRFAGGTDVTVGDELYADTAAASTACTTGGTTADDSGKFLPWTSLTASATETTDGTAAKKILNSWGQAMSAATSGNTAASCLVDLEIR